MVPCQWLVAEFLGWALTPKNSTPFQEEFGQRLGAEVKVRRRERGRVTLATRSRGFPRCLASLDHITYVLCYNTSTDDVRSCHIVLQYT